MKPLGFGVLIVAAAAALCAPAALARSEAAPSCSTVTPAQVKATLGVSTNAVVHMMTPQQPGYVLCYYGTSLKALSSGEYPLVQIGYQTTTGASWYAHVKGLGASLAQNLTGVGSAAFFLGMGGHSISSNNTVDVLVGTTFFGIVAQAPLAKVEQLARKIVPLV